MTDEAPKPPSGAAIRRKAREREEAARAGEPDDGKWAEEFETAGQPSLDDPGTDLDYTRRLQLIALRQMATTPFPTVAQEKCWRRIREMSAVVGMTSNRAQLEASVRRLKKQLEARQQSGSVVEVAGSSVKRPPTARGGPRGPRPVDPESEPS